jgi:Holliday junction resolvase-like predicted endonuclease
MASSDQRSKTEKAARTYLEMRGFTLLEQNWSLGKHKVDIIAQKDNEIYFICLSAVLESEAISSTKPIKLFNYDNFYRAAQAWTTTNKYSDSFYLYSIDISLAGYSIMGFNSLS